MSHARQAVQRCIERCVKAKDGRGRWRAENDCVAQLGAGAVAADTAAAARRIGTWLAAWPNVNPNTKG